MPEEMASVAEDCIRVTNTSSIPSRLESTLKSVSLSKDGINSKKTYYSGTGPLYDIPGRDFKLPVCLGTSLPYAGNKVQEQRSPCFSFLVLIQYQSIKREPLLNCVICSLSVLYTGTRLLLACIRWSLEYEETDLVFTIFLRQSPPVTCRSFRSRWTGFQIIRNYDRQLIASVSGKCRYVQA